MEKNPTLFVAVCAIFVPVIITAIQCFADWAIKRYQSKKNMNTKSIVNNAKFILHICDMPDNFCCIRL